MIMLKPIFNRNIYVFNLQHSNSIRNLCKYNTTLYKQYEKHEKNDVAPLKILWNDMYGIQIMQQKIGTMPIDKRKKD